MSQIPFVDRLGDAIEAAVADPKAARRSTRRRVRRLGLVAIAAVLALGGTAVAAQLLTAPEKLAATEVDCIYDPVKGGGGVGIHPGEQDPVAACRAFLAGHGKVLVPGGVPATLVACVRTDTPKVVVIAGRQGDCQRHGLAPLPGEYTPAREKVAKLERDLQAIERSAGCIPPQRLARQVQALLDRSGWTGWTASLRPDLLDGPCGHVLNVAEGGGRTLDLVLDSRQVLVWGESPQPTIDLLGSLSPALAAESVARCYTLDGLKAHVRQQVAPTGRRVSFKVSESLIPGDQLTGAKGARYTAGCAILQKVGPDPNGRDLIALIEQQR
jgi:hypothetical protein